MRLIRSLLPFQLKVTSFCSIQESGAVTFSISSLIEYLDSPSKSVGERAGCQPVHRKYVRKSFTSREQTMAFNALCHRATLPAVVASTGRTPQGKNLYSSRKSLEVGSGDGFHTASFAVSVAHTLQAPIVDELDVYRGLVLDTTYRPINIVGWKRALCLSLLEKADVLQYYDQVVKSPNRAWPLPAVLRVSGFVHTPKHHKRKLSLSRNNIFMRDKFRCQYCGSKDNLTIDHVKALSRGGGSTWENLVTACAPCNLQKGDRSPAEANMKLASKPKEPKDLDCQDMPSNYRTFRSLRKSARTPEEWLNWLPLKSQLKDVDERNKLM